MNDRQPSARVVAITGDKIAWVGGADEGTPRGRQTREIDCRGRTLVPGFIDAHLHFFSLVRKLVSIDLSPAAVSSIADIKEVVRCQAAVTPPGAWIDGTDLNEFYLAEKRCPDRYDLDAAAPAHPVVLSHRSLHSCVLNSRALALAGIDRQTPEPPGARIERDLATGEPNGILVEMLGYIREKVMPPMAEAEFARGVGLANEMFLANGITSFHEATYKNDLARWQTLKSLQQSGRLRSRSTMMCGPATWEEFRAAGLRTTSGDERLRLGAVKFLLPVVPQQEELNQSVLACHSAGCQVALHAVAESTVAAATSALEYADSYLTVAGRRHRIEHCGECPPYLLARLRRLGVVIVTQPSNIYYSGERYLATVARSQLPWLYRIRALREAGLVVAGSSDTPVVPCSPLVGIYAAVTRQVANGQTLLPEEAISPAEALALFTRHAAFAGFEEDIKGSITPGKLADLVLLSDDPTRLPPGQVKDVKVEMTIIGGEVVWEK